MTNEVKLAKLLKKKWQELAKKKKSFVIHFHSGAVYKHTKDGYFYTYNIDGKTFEWAVSRYGEIPNGFHSAYQEFASIMNKCQNYKKWSRDTKPALSYNGYSTDERVHSISYIKPCKEFRKLQERIKKLGDVVFTPFAWRADRVSGKRDRYHITESYYPALNPEKCLQVLQSLKGCKKANISFKRYENLEDMDYGIRYETEWEGSIVVCLVIETSKGKNVW